MSTALSLDEKEQERQRAYGVVDQLIAETSEAPSVRMVVERAMGEISRRLPAVVAKKEERSFSNFLRQSDPDLLATLVVHLLERDHFVSPEAKVRLRGQKMFSEMLKKAGGLYGQQEVAELLDITVGAVRKRYQANRLIGILRGDQRFYPVWQFEDGAVLPHFEQVLALLDTESDVAKVRFFLTPDRDLKRSPIEALRLGEHLEWVKRKASQYGHQMAT